MGFIFKFLKKAIQNNVSFIKYLQRTNPNIIIFIMYGLLYDSVINMYKPFGIKYLERIGGGNFHFALYNSLPGLIAVFALLPGAYFVSRFKTKKNITTLLFLISRSMLLVIACVPMLPKEIQPLAFVVIISLMNFPDALSQTSLQGFLGNVFNGYVRAQAITLRNKFGNFFIPIVTLTTGLIINFLPASDSQRIIYYRIFYVAAFLIGLMEVSVFRKFKEEIPHEEAPRIHISFISEILKNVVFRRYLAATLTFQFFWQMGWHLCSIYQIKNLGATEIWLALFAVSMGLGAFFSATFWNRFISKRGNHFTLFVSSFLVGINIILIALSKNLITMVVVNVFGGFASIGLNSTLFNGLLNSTPDKNRLIYLAVYNTFVNMSLFVAPLVGNVFFSWFGLVPTLLLIGGLRIFGSAIIYFFSSKPQEKSID